MNAGHVSLTVHLVTGDKVVTECPREDAERFTSAWSVRQWGGLDVPRSRPATTIRVEHAVKVTVG